MGEGGGHRLRAHWPLPQGTASGLTHRRGTDRSEFGHSPLFEPSPSSRQSHVSGRDTITGGVLRTVSPCPPLHDVGEEWGGRSCHGRCSAVVDSTRGRQRPISAWCDWSRRCRLQCMWLVTPPKYGETSLILTTLYGNPFLIIIKYAKLFFTQAEPLQCARRTHFYGHIFPPEIDCGQSAVGDIHFTADRSMDLTWTGNDYCRSHIPDTHSSPEYFYTTAHRKVRPPLTGHR